MQEERTYLQKSYEDILFEGRNQEYGSYILRGMLRRNSMRALIWIASAAILCTILMSLDLSKTPDEDAVVYYPVEVTLTEPPPIELVLPPAVPPAAEAVHQEELSEMVAVEDNTVPDKDDAELVHHPVDSTAHGTEAQGTGTDSEITGNGSSVYLHPEVPPQYPGGEKGLKRYLSDSVKYPDVAKNNGIQGTVVVVFIVNEDGSVSDVKLKKGIGGGCDQEAIRVVTEMRKWKPGKQGGMPVKTMLALPIGFSLSEGL